MEISLSKNWLYGVCFLACGALPTSATAQTIVQKTAAPFESALWPVDNDNSAGGSAKLGNDVAPELGGVSKNSLDLVAAFSGNGFEFFGSRPLQPLVIPGVTKKVSLWIKTDKKTDWVMQFKDGWNRSDDAGKKFEWNISKGADNTWKKVSFAVPADWVQPVTITGVFTHNWENKTQKFDSKISLDQLQIETDIADVDAGGVLKTWRSSASPNNPNPAANLPTKAPVTPLLQWNLSAAEEHNVFCGVRPSFQLQAQNWRAQAANGNLEWKVFDTANKVLWSGRETLKFDDGFALSLPIAAEKFGLYRLETSLVWNGEKSVSSSQPFALIPTPKVLSDAEKDASPYGLNVLSARQMMVETFRKAGIIWYRDYGFDYSWMTRAKGADKSYGGWPYYPKIVARYNNSGARILANTKTSIKPPIGNSVGPDLTWIREMVGIQTAFPSLRFWELDNEYDLNGANARAEDAIAWKNYREYHKKFGEIAQLLGGGQFVAVENGRAGIWPERVREIVKSGDFAAIDVINSHHYTGTDAPEINVGNHNMGFAGNESVMSFFDQLRAVKKAATSDGKARQHWLTEFGWDTKAGPVVSPREQAAYLSRAYMMLNAAGTEKGFWFFDLDSPDSKQFFDGCGLFTFDQMPKLSYAAFAGLTQILPKPQYIGMINAGESTWGYLFRNEGQLVAALWTLKDAVGPTVDFGNARVFDYLANPIASKAELNLEPTFAVGVADDSKWARQANYSLESPFLVTATSGDSITANLQVRNTRKTAIAGRVDLQLPQGWTATNPQTPIQVAAGKTTDIPITFRVGADEPLGEKMVRLNISEDAPLHVIPFRVRIERPIVMSVRALQGEPGESEVDIRISNRSARPLDGTLRLKLPQSWKTATPEIKVDALKPMEVRDVRAKVLWTPDWKVGEAATVEYQSADNRTAQQPLIPPRLTIYSAPNLKMDGDLKDWPARNKLPNWVLGSTSGESRAAMYAAWSPQGLHIAAEVPDSKIAVPDPRSFWAGDVLEVFVDTRDKKTPRQYEPGDHQFWLAPQIEQKRVYVGRWKRNNEIAETRYDIPNIQSAVVKKGDGYMMECFIPAALMQNWKPVAGARLGLNLNLSVKGAQLDREVFWTAPKSEAAAQPASWGTVILSN